MKTKLPTKNRSPKVSFKDALLVGALFTYALLYSAFFISQQFRPLEPLSEIKYFKSEIVIEPEVIEVPVKSEAELILERMDTKQKVGQLFMFGFYGTTPNEYIKDFIYADKVGAVILMKNNIVDADQTKALTTRLQQLATEGGHQIPLFIGVDQEGGVVNRVMYLDDGLYLAQSQLKDYNQAYDIANRRGAALSSVGFNMVFAPVLDIVDDSSSFIYARTFRDYQRLGYIYTAAELGDAMVEGFIDSNIIPVPKHFPGYTNDISDPHNSIPVSGSTMDRLLETTIPYKRLIESYDNSQFAVMSTPIIYSNIEANVPSPFSTKIQEELLRNTLGFSGVVITDDLRMAALNKYSVEETAVNSINGGNDIVMYTTNWQLQERAYNAVFEAVSNGQISEERLNSSVKRIIEAKLGLR